MAALAAGKHVVVDKPAMMTLASSERAVEAARRVNRARRGGDGVRLSSAIRGACGLCRRKRSADAGRRAIHHSAAADRQFSQSRANWAAAACWTWAPYAAATMRILGGGGSVGSHGPGRRPASGNRCRHGLFGAGPARQWRDVFRPFQLRGRVSKSLARCGPFGVCVNRARLHPTRRSSRSNGAGAYAMSMMS